MRKALQVGCVFSQHPRPWKGGGQISPVGLQRADSSTPTAKLDSAANAYVVTLSVFLVFMEQERWWEDRKCEFFY